MPNKLYNLTKLTNDVTKADIRELSLELLNQLFSDFMLFVVLSECIPLFLSAAATDWANVDEACPKLDKIPSFCWQVDFRQTF